MSLDTGIEWTDVTWNPIRGCSRVSEGCRNCYAELQAARFSGPGLPFEGLARRVNGRAAWTGKVRFVPKKLAEPLHWKKPRNVFVNSMSDLFHEKLSDEQIAAVFGVMAQCPQHTWQVLTKRPERAERWFLWVARRGQPDVECFAAAGSLLPGGDGLRLPYRRAPWPLGNVHLGVSVEDPPTAEERLSVLLRCPAAVRWASYEPALAGVDFEPWLVPGGLDWVVVGGESGPYARPFDLDWARQVVAQCRAASIPCFVKQLGSLPVETYLYQAPGEPLPTLHMARYMFRHSHGGDPAEWPEGLRVRQFPAKEIGP